MRVIAPTVQSIRPDARRARAMNLELLGLAAATIVVVFGIALAFAAKSAGTSAPAAAIRLQALTGPADLDPVLAMFPSTYERQVVGRALYRYASSTRPEHVGSLATVTLPAEQIRGDVRLTRLRDRLALRPNAGAIPVLSSGELADIKPRLIVRSEREFSSRAAVAVGGMLALFWVAHGFRRWRRRDDDPVLLPLVLLLCGIGIMVMLALRDPLRDTMALETFAWGVAAGISCLVLGSEIDFESSRMRRAVLLPLGGALTLAVLLLALGSGPGTSGVKVNLFGAQPVEVIRLLVVFALAAYFGRRLELLRELSEPATPDRPWLRLIRLPRWRDVRPVAVSMTLVLLFFFFQKDLGPALVLSCVFLAMFGVARGRAGLVVMGFAVLLAGFAAAYWTGVPLTVRNRVMIWSDPWNNGVPGGNHVAHGLWALATGGAWGAGGGLGLPNAIPEAHTDFVLAAVGEELGWVGFALVIAVYGFLCWRCLRAARRAPGDFTTFLVIGIVLILTGQALVIAGGYRFEYNPRLLSAARTLVRGSIYDRNGLPLATSRPEEIAALGATYENAAGVPLEDCPDASARCYPLGGAAFHVVGDWTHQANWAARNSSYVERDSDARLKGYDDRAQLVDVIHPRTGRRSQALRRDLRALLPLVRDRYRGGSDAAAIVRARDRDVKTTIDARLQVRVAAALRDGIESGRFARGAAVVLDPITGEVFAAASYPWPDSSAIDRATIAAADEEPSTAWLDRVRYGLYPPGSTFKLLVAGAALRSREDAVHFVCQRLPDGRVGNYVRGTSRPVRDDPMDTVPHGDVDLDRGLIVSCNAYFAQLAQAVGPQALLDAAALFQISVGRTPTAAALRPMLAQVGYGQGEALVTPLKLARVSAAIVAGGNILPVRWEPADPGAAPGGTRFLSASDAARLSRAMRAVVTTGTGRSLKSHRVAIAGKTGTAEITGAPAHAWFTGFAPYDGGGRRLAFAVLVENAGYGGRAAAPIAGAIVSAANELGLIK